MRRGEYVALEKFKSARVWDFIHTLMRKFLRIIFAIILCILI